MISAAVFTAAVDLAIGNTQLQSSCKNQNVNELAWGRIRLKIT